jgi:hypothetical protein
VTSPKRISLALQGGGSHGAFQWGVLDRLLEDERLEVGAITSASAGAFNAVAFASGMLRGGREGAKAELEGFWRAINQAGGRNVFGDHELWNAFTPWLKETPAVPVVGGHGAVRLALREPVEPQSAQVGAGEPRGLRRAPGRLAGEAQGFRHQRAHR